MAEKDFGAAVSGYLDPEGRAWEDAVYQAGKPVLDKEQNLSYEISSTFGRKALQNAMSSGWITKDWLGHSDPLSTIFSASPTANLLSLTNNLTAVVNGWCVTVAYTGNNAANELDLGAGPAGNGAKRTDLVILEVWRKLISASPDTDGKSTGGRIWRNGNVKVPAADDATLNFADDILDATLGSESTKRVQIQYRLRVVQGVDLFTYPSGIGDPTVVARSVPPDATTPDGNATVFTYSSQSSAGDPGLWRAGDGSPANTLNTVDGYMYAVPLVAVFRRNTTAFDRNLNHNGGVATPGPSDRPDGLFHDIINVKDVADLRRGTSFNGWHQYQEVAEKSFGFLLDNVLKTEWESTSIGGGVHGHTNIWADEIGVLPGDGTTTGDTPGATFVGEFDATRRFFSDRSNYEILTYVIDPSSPDVSTATWTTGTVVTINPASIAQYPYSGTISFITRAPTGTRIVDVVAARIEGSTGAEFAIDVGQVGDTGTDYIPVTNLQGLGVFPPTNITITLGASPVAGLTTEPMYIDLLIAYPSGVGLTKTPTADFGASSFAINNPAALPGTAPTSFSAMQTQALDDVHREAQLQYRTVTLTYTLTADSSAASGVYRLPERVHSLVQVRLNAGVYAGSTSMDVSGRVLTLSGGPVPAPGDVIDVDYEALRPMPQSGVQMTVYYEARAPQTVRAALVGTTQSFIPRWVSPFLYTMTTGSGSQGEGYPYPFAYVQTGGVIKDGATFDGEHELDGSPEVFVAEFNASTGFLKVPAFVPYVPSPEEVTFTRSPADTDIENRVYFPTVPAGYAPNAFGQGFSDERVHKVVLPTLMEASADTTLGQKGALYMVLLTRWAAFDEENSVKFLTSNNTTTAAVFRVSGNLINRSV